MTCRLLIDSKARALLPKEQGGSRNVVLGRTPLFCFVFKFEKGHESIGCVGDLLFQSATADGSRNT